jgi:hypothetical protein
MSTQHERGESASGAVGLDRREFLGGAGAVVLTATLPVAWSAQATPAPSVAPLLSDWTIDDMWGVYPRYAEPIDYPRAPRDVGMAAVDPVDEGFVVV